MRDRWDLIEAAEPLPSSYAGGVTLSVTLAPEQPIDGLTSAVLGRREEMGVDAEGEAGVGVAEVVGDGS